MYKLELTDMYKIEHFFTDVKFYRGKSVLEGMMGEAYVDNLNNPSFSYMISGKNCFIAGNENANGAIEMVRKLPYNARFIITNSNWYKIIEDVYKEKFEVRTRYSLKKDVNDFNIENLNYYAKYLPKDYEIKEIDQELYNKIKSSDEEPNNIYMTDDFINKGIGVCCLKNGEILGIAASYTIYKQGIEINIKVKESFRNKGIGKAIAANLIILCLNKGIYPSWDAANINSLKLAEKLGYKYDSEYRVYAINR